MGSPEVAIDSGQAQQSSGGGGRRRGGGRVKESIVENKKEEMQDYMEQAAGLIHQYVPPNPDLIEKSKAAGKVVTRPGAAGQVGLDFNDYLKPGDRLSVELDGANSRLLGLNVASYHGVSGRRRHAGRPVRHAPDGTSYTAQTTLDAKAKNVRVSRRTRDTGLSANSLTPEARVPSPPAPANRPSSRSARCARRRETTPRS